ncbi:DUF4393 domain-containing protein [Planococcus halocryophilus]|uniref:DUF4393 domain-containing protein n=1 Tax=Planococcus halocryophilus TaxID=1215089 RepID=UPI001F0EC7B3|nr:DUF4393 domain-containing protein [Planococcus halocryophilus]MCH4825767.1 DUF4393 domain-containing protein [Planococcus halocryophilus]
MDLITAGTALASFVAGKGAKAQLQTVDDLWYLVFNPITQMADKKRIENEYNINHYRSILGSMLLNIPEENLQEPQMSIVGPALEASKYYIEEEKLRKMFAKVIAASMDKTKSENVHHSFVEIIKQLSPLDAKNISLFKTTHTYPIAMYISQSRTDSSFNIVRPLVFSSDLINKTISEKDSSSISNLIRLGLLTHSFEQWLTTDSYYEVYRTSSLFHYLKKEYFADDHEFKSKNGTLTVTPLGKEFIEICL